jgi:sugar lactone lactonase YvrE
MLNRGKWMAAIVVAAWFVTPRAEAAVPEQIVALDASQGQLPESLAVDDDGTLYVSMGAQVARIDGTYAVSTLASLPVPGGSATGVKLAPSGQLYVATAAFDPTADASHLFGVDKTTGAVSLITDLDANGFPNDIAFDARGSTFVTDSFLGAIWKIDSTGVASVWLTDPLLQGNPSQNVFGVPFGANGIAFDRTKRKLYVSNTDLGAVLEIKVGRDGQPGEVEVLAAEPALVGADGLALDASGTVYVAVNGQDQLATVDKKGRVRVIAQGGALDSPSSLAFGTGHCDRHTLFVTSFAILRALGAKPGVPNPGILSLHVNVPGLRLP